MVSIEGIDDPSAATGALDPLRSRLLSGLREPASAAALAHRLGLQRQKQWGALTERQFVATASSYVMSPGALGPVAADAEQEVDRLSASYLIALAARITHELTEVINQLVATCHDESAPGGRSHRLVPIARPLPPSDAHDERDTHDEQ
ncbi:MAG: ArsR family transcriptional regulator [Nitriliruptor sp.]|nr:MAG: ArsR family transcriptional regulator [Nitriliruptor sp.]